MVIGLICIPRALSVNPVPLQAANNAFESHHPLCKTKATFAGGFSNLIALNSGLLIFLLFFLQLPFFLQGKLGLFLDLLFAFFTTAALITHEINSFTYQKLVNFLPSIVGI
jgi:hypothetical protein